MGLELAERLVVLNCTAAPPDLLDLLEEEVVTYPEDIMTDGDDMMTEPDDMMTGNDCRGLELADRLVVTSPASFSLLFRKRGFPLTSLGILFSFPFGSGKFDFLSIELPLFE
jgi:hypothetical protein